MTVSTTGVWMLLPFGGFFIDVLFCLILWPKEWHHRGWLWHSITQQVNWPSVRKRFVSRVPFVTNKYFSAHFWNFIIVRHSSLVVVPLNGVLTVANCWCEGGKIKQWWKPQYWGRRSTALDFHPARMPEEQSYAVGGPSLESVEGTYCLNQRLFSSL